MRSIRTLLVAAWALAVPLNLAQADQLESKDFSKNPLASQIEYYNKFGFPKAGRSLKQKIQEAEGFLNTDLPATTSVGVGFAVVYDDHAVITKGYGVRSTTDSKSLVTPDSLFEIGSVTKTMIAVAIGLLVQDGKLKWTDYAKTHLPWLKLKDPYAEQYVTIGNLLSMNSGFGRTPDFAWSIAYDDEKSFVEALASVDPESSLRETPMYGNANFEILGQVIHEVSGKPWYELLRDRVWIPLGMKNTFGSPRAVPATLMNTTMNQGHLTCGKNVLGPYNVAKEGALLQNSTMKYAAAGSVVSSVSDMTKFVRLMLNKGKVDGVVIFNDTSIITEITTGKNEVTFDASSIARGGGSVAAGYGVDIIGDLMWTRPYYSKNGGTSFHESDTVYTPIDGIGIVWLSNSVSVGDVTRIRLEQAAIYVTGIFLDIPKPILDYVLKKQREAIPKPASPFPGVPECGFSFWKNPPHISVDNTTRQAIVGTYYPATNPQFNPTLSIEQGASSSEFRYRAGVISGSASVAGNVSSTWLFATKDVLGVSAISAEQDAQGQFTIDFGVLYRKSWEQ